MNDMEARIERLEAAQHAKELRDISIDGKLDNINEKLDNMVLRVEFQPVRALVFGGVGMTLTAILAAMLGFVITHRGS